MASEDAFEKGPAATAAAPTDTKGRIVAALMALAAERAWEDFGLVDVAERAQVSLVDLRDAFPSKGAILVAFSKQIDRTVLEGTGTDLVGEAAKDRLFDVLMRRLDAMAPYKEALESILVWSRGDLLAGAALNGVAVNSMRFMLAAAGIESEGRVGAAKLQGLVLAWLRVLDTWFEEREAGMPRTMAALDRALERGGRIVARLEDLDRLASPLRSLTRAMFDRRHRSGRSSMREATVDPRDPDAMDDKWPRRPAV